jgi:hypothetical protein
LPGDRFTVSDCVSDLAVGYPSLRTDDCGRQGGLDFVSLHVRVQLPGGREKPRVQPVAGLGRVAQPIEKPVRQLFHALHPRHRIGSSAAPILAYVPPQTEQITMGARPCPGILRLAPMISFEVIDTRSSPVASMPHPALSHSSMFSIEFRWESIARGIAGATVAAGTSGSSNPLSGCFMVLWAEIVDRPPKEEQPEHEQGDRREHLNQASHA